MIDKRRFRKSVWQYDPRLSKCEGDIAVAIAAGVTSGEIALTRAISKKTVDTHRGNVLKKLGLTSTVALVHHAIREGWVKL